MEKEVTAISPVSNFAVRLDDHALSEMTRQRNMLAKFVQDQLKPSIDYGTLPGTDKNSLWKPGAEKIANIFQLGSRIFKMEKDMDFEKNIAVFSTIIEIYHIPTGKVIAQCEGICSSQEKKYKSRKVYEWNHQTRKKEANGEEQTLIGDVLNTLNKMAQKRAYVGAVIMATGASDFFTMDMDEDYENNEVRWDPTKEHKSESSPEPEQRHKVTPRDDLPRPFVSGKESGITPKPAITPVSKERSEIGVLINQERVRLKWTGDQLKEFTLKNFEKDVSKLSIEECKVLHSALQKQEA